jgi:hypothetical protein
VSTPLVLTPINGEPRVHDLALAERLGFERPRKIRDIIKRNEAKLLKFGGCPTVGRCIEVGNGVNREVEEFYLNQKQSIFVCMKSETEKAFDVQVEIVHVFDAYLNGGLRVAKPIRRRLPRKHYAILRSTVIRIAEWTAQPGRAKQALWERVRTIGRVEEAEFIAAEKMPEVLATLSQLEQRARAFVNDSKQKERVFIDTVLRGATALPAPKAQPLVLEG